MYILRTRTGKDLPIRFVATSVYVLDIKLVSDWRQVSARHYKRLSEITEAYTGQTLEIHLCYMDTSAGARLVLIIMTKVTRVLEYFNWSTYLQIYFFILMCIL